jgi:ATP-dependent RNA helicase RhlE
MSFSAIGLSEPVMKGVEASGYTIPTEIQRQAIPLALQGMDIIGCAPTGTGKTAAFVLPILQWLEQPHRSGRRGRFPRALILTPTRELCQQIEDSIRTYGKFSNVLPLAVYGGVDIEAQFRALRRGVDIVVATPGRLLDHIARRSVDLTHVEILVLDEADRMYDMGFIDDVRRIIRQVPRERQTMLFSATFSDEIRSLVNEILKDPQMIEVGVPYSPVDTVTQEFFSVPHSSKLDLLIHILEKEPIESMLVFSRTKHGADRICDRLRRKGLSATAIHSNRSQSQRKHALDGFKEGRFKILVATDLAARGLDVDGISHVVNFDTPVFAEDYIHRIGRTGRAEAKGTAYTLVCKDEMPYVKRIGNLTGTKPAPKRYPDFAGPDDLPPAVDPSQPEAFRSKRRYYRTPRFA